ncbi:rhodanese-like domain-containing protein [Magnetospirillum moscoviense]|nr:rhodanese-like domain-containing protein [Magnetospirillum moscoviense]MBF0325467.1 rhodanese-like domain-containing protein [Alphaproteobacteria bacterium]
MLNRLFGQMFSAPAQPENVHMVSPVQVRQWLDSGVAVLVDVREPNEVAAETIAGSINLPLSSFDAAKLPKVPEGKKLVLHCRSGQRCGMAAAKLVQAGYTGEINRMEGGIMGWRMAGGPTRPGA